MHSDLIGQRFSRLLVIGYQGYKRVEVRCDCGAEKFVHACQLRSGTTMSCGCLRAEVAPLVARKHGRSHTKEHAAWKALRARCMSPRNKDFRRYGGRGITICQRWLDSFEAFLADMGPAGEATSIDRIDVHGNYEPGNCRWATVLQQANNKTNSRRVTHHHGREQTAAQWAREFGINYGTFLSRLSRGAMGDRLFATPAKR